MKAFQTPSKTPSKTDTSPSPSSLLSSSSTPRSLRFREDSIPESLSSSLPEDSPSALQRLLRVRGSPVAASRYHRWVVTERNFGSGQEVRDGLEVDFKNAYLWSGKITDELYDADCGRGYVVG